jgi:hypothetical protein
MRAKCKSKPLPRRSEEQNLFQHRRPAAEISMGFYHDYMRLEEVVERPYLGPSSQVILQ